MSLRFSVKEEPLKSLSKSKKYKISFIQYISSKNDLGDVLKPIEHIIYFIKPRVILDPASNIIIIRDSAKKTTKAAFDVKHNKLFFQHEIGSLNTLIPDTMMEVLHKYLKRMRVYQIENNYQLQKFSYTTGEVDPFEKPESLSKFIMTVKKNLAKTEKNQKKGNGTRKNININKLLESILRT